MLVARLGLRSIEVARLELGDIDWRAGEIAVAGKARRRDRLPLPHGVGQALTAYLRQVRPATSIRTVFLMLKAPIRPIRADLVGDVTRRTCHRAGLPEVGPHRLRHALATEMLRRGAKLVEISQVLRHRDLATTAIYARGCLSRGGHQRARGLHRPAPGPALDEEYRVPHDEEWEQFLGNFERRKVALGDCGRSYDTPCIHEHSCLRCPLLRAPTRNSGHAWNRSATI